MQKFVIGLFLTVLLATSCTEKDNGAGDADGFNRGEMLVNYADNLIIPAYQSLFDKTQILQDKIYQLTQANATVQQLQNARIAWVDVAEQWQFCNTYNFGPAGEMGIKKGLNEEVATFPVSATKINNLINANDTSFANFDRDSRGIFAIEYLLYTPGLSDVQMVDSINQNNNKINYLRALINQVVNNVSVVKNDWTNYRQSFITNTGTDIGSSTSLLYNEFLKSYEGLKNFKFGIPLGRRPGQTSPLPEQVEAYYSGYSTQLAKLHWLSIKQIYQGQTQAGIDGLGFNDYLQKVVGGNDLLTLTAQQVAVVDAKFAALPNIKLSDAITQQFQVVDDVHTELQKTTRFYKSDMSSLLGIAITYSSGDGD